MSRTPVRLCAWSTVSVLSKSNVVDIQTLDNVDTAVRTICRYVHYDGISCEKFPSLQLLKSVVKRTKNNSQLKLSYALRINCTDVELCAAFRLLR